MVLTPGIMTLSMSAITSCQLSGVCGASLGIRGRKYPGSTSGNTRLKIKIMIMQNCLRQNPTNTIASRGRFQFH